MKITLIILSLMFPLGLMPVLDNISQQGINKRELKIHDRKIDENLLTNRIWHTCAWIDSINQFPKIQFIKRKIIDSNSNCTTNNCAYSKWTFFNEIGNKELKIENLRGCSDEKFYSYAVHYMKWKYDSTLNTIEIEDPKKDIKLLFSVSALNENGLFLINSENE